MESRPLAIPLPCHYCEQPSFWEYPFLMTNEEIEYWPICNEECYELEQTAIWYQNNYVLRWPKVVEHTIAE